MYLFAHINIYTGKVNTMDLNQFFRENNKVAVAFSGGVDSSYLLYAAVKAGAQVTAYYVNAAFQPQFELDDAIRLAAEVGAEMKVLEADVLSCEDVVKNPSNRCYYCKQQVFGNIWEAARADGYSVLLDGTNASDDVADRPGMKALKELTVKSPLRECGLTKAMVRELSKEAGLFTWDKPSYACLATRIPAGTMITRETLEITEKAEGFMAAKGYSDFRIRMTTDGSAKIQLKAAQLSKLMAEREEILKELKKYYKAVTLDLEVR